MPADFREALVQEIATLEGRLDALRAALAAYDLKGTGHMRAQSPSNRFEGMRPTFRAIEIVLTESGGKMKRSDLMDQLVAGGAIIGKKRGLHNLRISIDDNAALGKLKVSGDDVELVR